MTFICQGASGLALVCCCLPAHSRWDNSIVSRSGWRSYSIRKLVWSCCNQSRNSLICSYHAGLQRSFPDTADPASMGPALRHSIATRCGPGCPPRAGSPALLPWGSHKSMERREKCSRKPNLRPAAPFGQHCIQKLDVVML